MLQQLLVTTAIGVGLYGAGYAAPFALRPFAEQDSFMTYLNPGEGKMIKRGGEFHNFYISLPGYHLNRPGSLHFERNRPDWEILPDGDLDSEDFDNRPGWMKDFGYFWVGIPGQRSVNRELFIWNEFTGDGHKRIGSLPEKTNIFKVNSFPYVMVEIDIMTADALSVKVVYVISLRITNPHLALIEAEDWMTHVRAAISQRARNFIGKFRFDQLISLTNKEDASLIDTDNFSKSIMGLNTSLINERAGERNRGTKDTYGVTIESADLQEVLPVGPLSHKHLESLSAEFTAIQAAIVAGIDSVARASATTVTGEAEAGVIKAKLEAEATGKAAMFKAAEESLEGAKAVLAADALGKAGTTFVIPNGLTDVLNTVASNLTKKP